MLACEANVQPIRRRSFAAGGLLMIATALTVGCEPASNGSDAEGTGTSPVVGTNDTGDASGPTDAPSGRRGYEIPIPQLEYWADTQVLKYSYEMRFDPPDEEGGRPRLHRNGWARAYYLTGGLEREGAYRYIAANGRSERVGRWTYYTPEGAVDRVEERGGEVIWTAPDQLIAPPGTSPETP